DRGADLVDGDRAADGNGNADLAERGRGGGRAGDVVDHGIVARVDRDAARFDRVAAIAEDVGSDVGADLVHDEDTRSAHGHAGLSGGDRDRAGQDAGVDVLARVGIERQRAGGVDGRVVDVGVDLVRQRI